VIKEAVRRAGINNEDIDEVIMGSVLPHRLGQNPARQTMVRAGLAWKVGAITVNKVCGADLKVLMLAAQAIQCENADVIVAGGQENMNLVTLSPSFVVTLTLIAPNPPRSPFIKGGRISPPLL
jgi:acetyl-CoA C-acetyltransferase